MAALAPPSQKLAPLFLGRQPALSVPNLWPAMHAGWSRLVEMNQNLAAQRARAFPRRICDLQRTGVGCDYRGRAVVAVGGGLCPAA